MTVAILGDGLLARSILDVFVKDEAPGGYAVMLGHHDFEITSLDSIVAALKPHKPDVLINTVALHSLARCEDDPMLAQLINAIGAGRVAGLVPTIYVSTDYVFNDGGPHDETMPGQRPRSVYGQTKLAGELATLEHGGLVVRVAGLYGHHRSHKGPTFPETVTSGFTPLKLPTDQRFSPTYAPDAAKRIADLVTAWSEPAMLVTGSGAALVEGRVTAIPALSIGDRGVEITPVQGIYHAANAGSATWYEFGTHIAEVTRHKRVITGYAAHDRLRPTSSALRSTRLPPLRHWMHALNDWAIERERSL